ncbi:N2227-like protein-domain-containing protein [Gymnopilus junonius]|uniref:N2227-like protein-domain-containing protein n=1 Tax=Gymnopilus junonius TaxID=109634 RepID=A0A9P5NZ43_GYMJU|nr:N2227-like protein-domain-containing protein [Gymnopilus junonius]
MSFSDLRFIIASDVLLACFFPLLVLVIGYRYFPTFSFAELRDIISLHPRVNPGYGHFSLQRAYHSFVQYPRLSAAELNQMRATYAALGRANKHIGYKIRYPRKLDRLRDVTELNAVITDAIVELALDEFPSLHDIPTSSTNSTDLGRVRESLKHFVRDWSEEGSQERARIFAPILGVLQMVKAKDRASMKVLVPGCGLGRLAWDISQLGFNTTANELSFFMTLAFRLLLSPKTTASVNEHTLHPYAHWFSHQRSNDSLFRPISFPDVIPRLGPSFRLIEENFMKLSIPSPERNTLSWSRDHKYLDGYDYIITLFFIDTSLDVLATMAHIYNLLRPGGMWINLGPLLWAGGGQAKIELSLEEVLQAAEEIGFIIETEDSGPTARRTVECEYTGDKKAMMRWIYKAEFWVARKSK